MATREELERFAQSELERLDKERAEAIIKKGGLPYIDKFPVGESLVVLEPALPKDDPAPDGKVRKMFTVSKWDKVREERADGGKQYAYSPNMRSPVYKDLVHALRDAPVVLKVVRTGMKKEDTRYTILVEKKL